MLQLLSLLSLLPLAFAAPALNTPDVAILKPIQISKFNFNPISFTFNDRNTKIKTTCSSTIIPTAFTSCQNPNISFKFAQGDKANDFHISLKESYTSQETYNVILATKEVTKSPKKFNVPIQNIYPFQPFSLPEIYTFSPSGRPGSSPYATLNATVTDVNVDGKPTTKCTTQWIFGEQPPSGDIPCADPSFILHITEFKGIGQFTLTLNHTYPLKTGTKISTSGSLTLDNQATDRNFVCTYGASGVGSCAIAEGKAPLEAPIDSVTGFISGVASCKVSDQIIREQDGCHLPTPDYMFSNYAGVFTATINPTLLEFEWSNPGTDGGPQIVIDNVIVGPSNP